ncbi:T9SS type A sorting domain-containing protein [Dyadobacter sandarakinus]|uniref:T9SS type A sorting domain-containing protein n=1 Tax=Dyadobacter sandarakinus TaxID=2747268 RepID=A0ABX7I174_9BACT|nr:T9SS type A sorting domain-containing protein [Dyadobacter sandarakinus]QRQ99427.1 T9SS type A sorting domain-containing protein [Dyadobacter sandarakinus]
MGFNLKMCSGRLLTLLLYLLLAGKVGWAQDCQPGYVLNPVTANNTIEWDKFPEFTLPFTVIYSATRFGDTQSQPLKHGFSHLAMFSGSEPGSLPAANRANLWYGVATSSGNQPWADNALRSPWGNDTAAYRAYWDNYAATIYDASIFCLDIERMQREDRDILALKSNANIPQSYRNLPDADFISTYKRDMRWWYTEAINRFKSKKPGVLVSSYSDVPVRNTWLNITSNSWQDWTTNAGRTHYLTQNDAGQVGGSFYNAMDFLTPSPYYYYGYDHPIGKDYLSYLLFNIEANVAWSNKPVIPFVWMRVHDSYDPDTPLISDFMAEATAIFPFFSGAKGLWLWENPFFPGNRQENYSTYEHFIYGLYRLSAFKNMFEGNYELVIPMSARDHMALQNPVWRGLVKGSEILIAAQNPYAADQTETQVLVSYQKWVRTITLRGKEVFLCKFDLNDTVTSAPEELTEAYVYPNAAQHELNVVLSGANAGNITFSLVNLKGQVVMQKLLRTYAGETRDAITLPRLASGMYFARFSSNSKTIIRKVVVHQ